jgi:hypothetical protein
MADFDLKKFDLEHWWKLLAAAGATIVVASIAVKFTPTIFLGLGLLACGIGEWIDHPLQTKIGQGFKITGYPRSPSILGVVLDGVGIVLAIVGLIKLAFT